MSAASAWEITIKQQLGKLFLDGPADVFVPSERDRRQVRELPIEESSALLLSGLPNPHRDPFDRMLVCQAIDHGMSVVTPDPLFRNYPVKLLW